MRLEPAALVPEGVTVRPSFFVRSDEQPAGTVRFSAEDIRRAPGSAGDISRIILGLPSLAKVSDQYSGLAVRGGSPAKNAFYVDNVEIPKSSTFRRRGARAARSGC